MNDKVREFLALHKAEHYDWHTSRQSGTSTLEHKDNTIRLTPTPTGVLLCWFGRDTIRYKKPSTLARKYRFFEAGEYREETEKTLRRIAG